MDNSPSTNAKSLLTDFSEFESGAFNAPPNIDPASVSGDAAPNEAARSRATGGDAFNRLHSRARQIASDLNASVESVSEVQKGLDEERRSAGRFAAEMLNWDRVLTQLEQYAKGWWLARPAAVNHASPARDEESIKKLLRALTDQENQIRSLEMQLEKIRAGRKPPLSRTADPYVNRLIVTAYGNETLKFPLTSNIVTIGRDPKNQIQLRARHVSRFHARIVSDANSAYIEDLNSANGIMVNSTRVKRQKLRSGDLVIIGRMQLKFIDLMDLHAGEGKA